MRWRWWLLLLRPVRSAVMTQAQGVCVDGVIAAASTQEMERCAGILIGEGDAVLEVGSQLGRTTEAVAEAAGVGGRVVAVDVARKAPRRATARSAMFRSSSEHDRETVEFRELARLDAWREALSDDDVFDAVVVDAQTLHGMDLPLDTLALVDGLRRRQDAPCVVLVKSASLARLGGRLFRAATLDVSRVSRVLSVRGARRRAADAERIYENEPLIITGSDVAEYRSVIPTLVSPGDAVLEVGCHFGTTTSLLHSAVGPNGLCVGVDVGASIIRAAKDKHPHVDFRVGDAWATGGLSHLSPTRTWDLVFVDVGGLSSADGVLEALALVRSLGAALDPRAVVIKSKCLQALADTILPSTRLP